MKIKIPCSVCGEPSVTGCHYECASCSLCGKAGVVKQCDGGCTSLYGFIEEDEDNG